MNRISRSPADTTIDAIVYISLILASLVTVIPFLQVITISLSPPRIAGRYGLHIIPTEITLEGYRRVLTNDLIWSAYGNTIFRTVVGTALSITIMVLGAYPLSKPDLPHRRFWTAFIVFTMYFQGGIIPQFILVNGLGLRDSLWALILPRAAYAFNLIIIRNFFMQLPREVEESARMDGAHDLTILLRIVIPLSMPVLATVTLWKAVFEWNQWFDCMIYIQSQTKFVLQYVLRLVLIEGQDEYVAAASTEYVSTDTVRMATLVVAALPIILVYPFLQRYFVKGVMLGSVKE